MYKEIKSAFGEFEKITLINEASGNGLTLIPEAGGVLTELLFESQNVLVPFSSPEELTNNIAFRNALLFPFPNRLEHGTYEHLGTAYSFPINDPSGSNALHGIIEDVHFDVLKIETNSTEASIQLSYFNEGTHPGYPFAFLLDIKYSISDETGFKLDIKFTNEANQSIPAGFGWHPYFKIGETINDCSLKMPEVQFIEVNENLSPTGKFFDYDYFHSPKLIGKSNLDNAFKLIGNNGILQLSNESTNLEYWQETGAGKFNFIQIYTPDSRGSIAIEPMTCNINAFNNKDGLILLEPEHCITASCGVRVNG